MPEYKGPDHQKQPPLRGLPHSITLTMEAVRAIEELMGREGFYEGSKARFAEEMGWLTHKGLPDRRRVEDVCNLTRDAAQLPEWQREKLGGFVISYAPSRGGMTLISPDGTEMELYQHVHVLVGDLTRDQSHRTENRRRKADWLALSAAAFKSGDSELARLANHAENEVDQTGFVSEHTTNQLWQLFASRGLS